MYVDRELKSKQLYSRINALENVIIEIELNNTRMVVTTIAVLTVQMIIILV